MLQYKDLHILAVYMKRNFHLWWGKEMLNLWEELKLLAERGEGKVVYELENELPRKRKWVQ